MAKFSLRLEPIAGCSIQDCIIEAVRIASTIGLGCVTFKGNGNEYLCFPNGRATKFTDSGEMDEWDGKSWSSENIVRIPPGVKI